MNQLNMQERIAYSNTRKDLLQFFLGYMYSNNIELFNTKNDPFLNDVEWMKYFIDRFNQYYNEETYENHNSDSIDSSYVKYIILYSLVFMR